MCQEFNLGESRTLKHKHELVNEGRKKDPGSRAERIFPNRVISMCKITG